MHTLETGLPSEGNNHSGEFPFRLLFSQYLFQIPCTRFYKCHNLQVLQHLELKFGLWKEKTMIHVRFLLVAVIIQDIGLLLDSNNSGDIFSNRLKNGYIQYLY